jgi:hypothetical protein
VIEDGRREEGHGPVIVVDVVGEIDSNFSKLMVDQFFFGASNTNTLYYVT